MADAVAEETSRLQSMREELERIEKGQAKPALFRDPARPGWVGEFLGVRYAASPPAPLAPLSIGQRDLYPFYFEVTTLSAYTFTNTDEIENPLNLVTWRFDVAFVVIYLVPLFIFGLSYNLLSTEREAGTLFLALAQPIGVRTLIAGKVLARGALVIGVTVVLSIVSAAVGGADLSDGDTLARLAWWSLGVVCYALFWFAAAVAINTLTTSSATNAVALVSLWLVLVIVVPALTALLVSWWHPVPSRLAFINTMRDERRDTANRTAGLRDAFYVEHPDLKPAVLNRNDWMSGFYAAQLDRDRRLVPLADGYDAALDRQHALAERLRYLSPALALQVAFDDLAATGYRNHAHFLRQVLGFHRSWQASFLPRMFKETRLGSQDYADFPRFTFVPLPLPDILTRILCGLGGVVALTIGCATWALRRVTHFVVIS